ncbi:MAG: CHAT domain-containing tetratricopeptide repeat protein [Gilvibacter sp.]
MSKAGYLTIVALILSLIANAQNQDDVGYTFDSIQNSALSDSLKITRINSLILNAPMANDSLLGAMHHRLGLLHYRLKAYDSAVSSTKKAIIFRQSPGQTASLKHNSQYNLSFYYNALGQIQNRIQVLNTLVSDQNPDRFTFRSLIELGYYYSDLGDYYKSLQSFELVVHGFEVHQDNRTLALGYMGLIYVISLMEAPDIKKQPIEDYIIKVQDLAGNVTPSQLASCHTNIGRLYENLEKPAKSVAFYEMALQFYKSSKNPEMAAILLNNLGSVKAKAGSEDEAITLFKEGIKDSRDHNTRAVLYDNLAYYTASTNAIQAQDYYQKALLTAVDKEDSKIFNLPTYDTIAAISNKSDLLRILTDYAQFLYDYSDQLNKNETLLYAKDVVLLADFLVTLIRDESQIEQSKLLWIGRGVNVYMLGVRISYALNDAKSAFYFIEKNKAILLLENVQRLHSKDNLNIPAGSLKRKRTLQTTLAKSAQISLLDPTAQHQSQYLADFTRYHSFIDSLKQGYPSFLSQGRYLKIKSIEEVKAEYVNSQTAVVTYILDDFYGFGLFIDAQETQFFALENHNELAALIEKVTTKCKSPFEQTAQRTVFWEESNQLYNILFPVRKASTRLDGKSLIVVPDYSLQQLPFEALTTVSNNNAGTNVPYLIKNTKVSYLHSFSVNALMDASKLKQNEQTLLAVTPEQFLVDSLAPLRRSSKEAAYLKRYFKTTRLSKASANKAALLNKMGDYAVLHFSTHAGYAEYNKQPWLALYDNIVSLEELYGIPTNAQLVTLGACKTAEGLYAKGEGTLSLSRAFFITGSRAVLASLWNANEKSNALIMEQFYSNLNDGATKDDALQKAKLNYLNAAQLSETSPYYWANLTITGQVSAISNGKNISFLYWLTGLILLLVTGILVLKQRRRTS